MILMIKSIAFCTCAKVQQMHFVRYFFLMIFKAIIIFECLSVDSCNYYSCILTRLLHITSNRHSCECIINKSASCEKQNVLSSRNKDDSSRQKREK